MAWIWSNYQQYADKRVEPKSIINEIYYIDIFIDWFWVGVGVLGHPSLFVVEKVDLI